MSEPKVPLRRLEESILAFEEQPIVKGKILFYGSSTFTRWKERYHNPNLEDVIRMKDGSQACVNHGFGSCTAEEMLYYYPRAVRPWEPRALVLFSFGNDHGYGYSPAEVMDLLARVMEYARTDFPGIRLFLCNIRPSLSQLEKPPETRRAYAEYDRMAAEFCAAHGDVTFVDNYACTGFFEEGHAGEIERLRTDIFVKDRLHNNALGYEEYRKFFTEVLKELL